MLRSLIFDFVVPVLLFFLLRSVLSGFLSPSPRRRSSSPSPQQTVSPGGELKKDPVCGTYVSTTAAIHEMVRGQTVYFCSPECRAKYLKG